MSLTWICPLEGPAAPFDVLEVDEDEDVEPLADELEEPEADLEIPEGCNLLGCF